MTDSASLSFVKCFYKVVGLVGDTPDDLNKLPDRVNITGSWTLTPRIDKLLMLDMAFPETVVPIPISGIFEDSLLMYNGDPYVWLLESPRNDSGVPLFLWKFTGEYRYKNEIRLRDEFTLDPKPDTSEPGDHEYNLTKFRT